MEEHPGRGYLLLGLVITPHAWQGFEHADGRLAAASTLKALIGKLPEKLLAQWVPLFYMPLVLGMMADPDASCRQMLSAALGALLQVAHRRGGGSCAEAVAAAAAAPYAVKTQERARCGCFGCEPAKIFPAEADGWVVLHAGQMMAFAAGGMSIAPCSCCHPVPLHSSLPRHGTTSISNTTCTTGHANMLLAQHSVATAYRTAAPAPQQTAAQGGTMLPQQACCAVQYASPESRDLLAGYALAWLRGRKLPLARAALQSLSLQAAREGPAFARRLPALLPLLLPLLQDCQVCP